MEIINIFCHELLIYERKVLACNSGITESKTDFEVQTKDK